ncbi:uncharacterized protein K02A2.6-like, partial [Frankliniella occidentalis]|uniref:RNA-directed DNA polymerase n=1 Tax=Frankliniella occidentalis TaxID=133901 RepID=A0A6J1TC01_FRAOC
MPTIEEAFSALSGGAVFSKIDLTDAYTQLAVDDDAAKLLTVATHKGLFSVHRLPYGLSAAPGIFQRMMCDLLTGMDGVVVWLDDILVTGRTRQEHDGRLHEVLKRISDKGLRVNAKKCQFHKSELEYLGFKLDSTGRQPMRKRVAAILDAPPPTDVSELRSFLGKLNFYDKFLESRATIFEPLYRLSDNDKEWVWGEAQQNAFEEAKKMLCSAKVLVHYDLKRELVVCADGSPVGVGAVLAHTFPDGEKPIEYASRALSKAEKNYSQTDREALSIVFAVKKWHNYLCGRHFTIITDHKPLLGLFGTDKPMPTMISPRVERWLIMMGCYSYTIKWRPGKQHGNCDALSRLCIPGTAPDKTPEPYGLFLMTGLSSPHLTWQQVAQDTAKDPILSKVKKWTQEGWPTRDPGGELSVYFQKREALSMCRDCILWGIRVVIPKGLREAALRHLHAAHLGVVKSKRLARVLFWWPGLPLQVEQMVAHCPACQATRANAPALPVTPWPEPTGKWQRLHIDFAGPYHGKHFIVVVDAYTRWMEVKFVKGPTSEATMQVLENVFNFNGFPHTIVSDNGTAFKSHKFNNFCSTRGIRQLFTAPRMPQSNGHAERMVRTIKEKLSQVGGANTQEKLDRIVDALRSTPGQDGESPNQRLFGRELRTPVTLTHNRDEEDHDHTGEAVDEDTGKAANQDEVWADTVWNVEEKDQSVDATVREENANLTTEGDEQKAQPEQPQDEAGAANNVQVQAEAEQHDKQVRHGKGRGRRSLDVQPSPERPAGRKQPERSTRNPNPLYVESTNEWGGTAQ